MTDTLQSRLEDAASVLDDNDAPACAEAVRKAMDVLRERMPAAPRPLAEYHEDYGFVTWWIFPVCEPAWIGSPNCSDWPGYHTHWTPHPPMPVGEDR